ncbi:NAD(P)-dependent oxidoreductase [Deinococcus irradiatisoli]|uniref:NAD(P)-dependent oxidoreductase n=1 Tax=Deinococcus irradiatisoli TaxID=2202254 RepID=A0A2Z3JDQ4_9DEIO|nr:SDR family oxidoreductase [Deinococcus irradiatisoli]AWN23297.1 NAD(P)-dependent oxidoreductase [Deinococcus irradiatisoli]
MILITGATGQLGSAVMKQLLKRTPASQIAALVRDPGKASALEAQGAAIRTGSYDDLASLDRAMQGVEKVLLIAGTDEDNRVRQHQNVIDAARQAGVTCIAYTSRSLKDRRTVSNKLMQAHFETEDAIKASGLNSLLFRNVLYLDAVPGFVGEGVFERGIQLPTAQGRLPFALRSEMGEAIANALLDAPGGQTTYTFTGSQPASFGDIAAALSRLSGKAVTYTPIEPDVFEAHLRARGVPEVVIPRIVGFLTDIRNGQEDEVSSDLEHWLGRRPASLEAGLRSLYNL